jgi:Cupin domain
MNQLSLFTPFTPKTPEIRAALYSSNTGRAVTRLLTLMPNPPFAFIYATVLEGAIRSQVNDGPVTIYKAGESFSEMPGDRHRVSSANASETKQAKLLAVFLVNTNETELTIPLGN